MRRRLTGLALLSLTTAIPALPADAACARAKAERSGRWFESRPPLADRPVARQALFGNDAYIRAVAVDPANRTVLFVTDGEHLLRSNDGGCSWKQVYALPAAPGLTTPDGTVGDIVSMDVARVGGRTRVLLAVRGFVSTMPTTVRTVVVRSDDGVTGWTPVVDPLTFAGGDASWLPVVRSAGQVAYLAYPSLTGEVTYARSGDGGKTWVVREPPDGAPQPSSVVGLAVNPYNANEVWDWTDAGARDEDAGLTGLRRSTDGGATWVPVDPWPAYPKGAKPGWRTLNVAWPKRGGPARVIVPGEGAATTAINPVVSWSGDGGRTFQAVAPPLRTVPMGGAEIATLPNGDAVLVSTNDAVYRIRHRGRPPVRADWRVLPKLPGEIGMHAEVPVRAAGTLPGAVVVAGLVRIDLLAVWR